MKKLLFLAIVLVVSAASVYAADTLKTPYKPAWYAEHYPFMQGQGSVWTFESEFLWPEGFRRLDQKKLTGYQFWISNLPLWHYGQGVGSLARGTVLVPEKISRTLNLPWRTTKFYDCMIPLQLLAEYVLYLKKPNEPRPRSAPSKQQQGAVFSSAFHLFPYSIGPAKMRNRNRPTYHQTD
jgi:hypothetical protein